MSSFSESRLFVGALTHALARFLRARPDEQPTTSSQSSANIDLPSTGNAMSAAALPPTEAQPAADELSEYLDLQPDERPADPEVKLVRDPALAAARFMLDDVLEPLAAAASMRVMELISGARFIVIEAPSAAWVQVLGDVWLTRIGRTKAHDYNETSRFSTSSTFTPYTRPVLCCRDGSASGSRRMDRGDLVSTAALSGVSAIGVSQSPAAYLPADLVAAADLTLVIDAPNGSTVQRIAEALTGAPPSTLPPSDGFRGLEPWHLRAAWSEGQSADQFVGRLLALLARSVRGRPAQGFDALPGMDQAVAWGKGLETDLTAYRRGEVPWTAVDRGILLAGPPGTGKTSFARALAAECRVPLIATSYAAWQGTSEGHLGDVIRAMRRSFDDARKAAPSILFIDELDTVGRRGQGRRHEDWWRTIINALLELLDGLADREGVVVIGATNDPGNVDPAILRSGRLEQVVTIPLPDAEALDRIFRVHLQGDLADSSLSGAVLDAMGATGADVERWVRGARRRARQDGARGLRLDDLLSEISGGQDPLPADYKWRVAVHEAGHAVAHVVLGLGPLVKVSLRGRSGPSVGGTTSLRAPVKAMTEGVLADTLVEMLAGRAAETEVLGEWTAGAGGPEYSDLGQASHLALAAESAFGLVSPVWQGFHDPRRTGKILRSDSHLRHLVHARLLLAQDRAEALVRQHRQAIEAVANALMERDILPGEEVEQLVRPTLTQGDHP